MSEKLLESAKKRYGQAEVYRVTSESHPISFENNRLKEVMRRDQAGVALRVIHNGRIGFSSTTNPEREAELVDRAGALAEFGSEAHFAFEPQGKAPDVTVFDPAVKGVSDSELIAKGKKLLERLRSEWPDALCDVRIGRSWGETALLNSAGTEVAYEQSSYYVALGAQLIRGTDMLNVWASRSSSGLFGEDEDEIALKEVLKQLRLGEKIAKAPSGDVPVIFTPRGVGATLLNPLLSGFNGKNYVTGSSPIIGREGTLALDPRLSIYDDPLIAGSVGSRPFDDEGVPSRKVTLIGNGVIGEPVFDLQTAGEAGKRSTGSAHRGLTSAPGPGTSVVDISAGDTPYKDMVADMKEGLVIEGLLGAGQGNELGGDFRANVALGYRVENGEITGRVKDTIISGNVYKVLAKVEAISDAAEWVYGSLRSPALRCLGVEVASGG